MTSRLSERTIELVPDGPYDFAQVLLHLRTSASAILEHITADAYERALELVGRPVVLRLSSVGTVAQPRLALTVRGEVVDKAVMQAASAQVRRVFMLDVDPTPFLAQIAGDPIFSAQLAPFAGLRPVIMATPYESLLWAIIGQQINVAFAAKLKRVLVELAGRQLVVAGQTYSLLPQPAAVAALDPVQLRERQFSQQKTAYVQTVSAAIAAGEIEFATVQAMPFEEAITALTRFRGIGRWTAECLLMRGLGVQDSLPAGDIALRAVIGRAYGLERHASEAEVRTIAEAWAGWRGWAAFFWWRIAQAGRHGLGE